MVFIVHGRYDNKYLGSEPEFEHKCNTIEDAKIKFNEELENGAGTIFLEHYNKFGEQIKCYNNGHRLVDC